MLYKCVVFTGKPLNDYMYSGERIICIIYSFVVQSNIVLSPIYHFSWTSSYLYQYPTSNMINSMSLSQRIIDRKNEYMNTIYLDPYSAGIDFSRQNLTSVDVRF